MAFNMRNLSHIAYANGFTLWHYRAAHDETLQDLDTLSYFVPAVDLLTPGDIVLAVFHDGAAIRVIGQEAALHPLKD